MCAPQSRFCRANLTLITDDDPFKLAKAAATPPLADLMVSERFKCHYDGAAVVAALTDGASQAQLIRKWQRRRCAEIAKAHQWRWPRLDSPVPAVCDHGRE